jgi:hypothetical protein
MSPDDDVSKTLGTWLGKAQKIGRPPERREVKGTLDRPETVRGQSTKRRIKQLAVRDNITLLTMLDRMLELYEREYGKLGK